MKSIQEQFDLSGKTAVITGASYGLGVTFAKAMSMAGANVVVTARSTDKLQGVADEIIESGGQALPLACDVTDEDQVDSMVAQAWDHFGRVDVLINNAGISAETGMLPEKVPSHLFEQTVRVNLLGVWHGCRSAGSRMLQDGKGGSIINIASIAGLAGWRDFPPAYQATKAAVINLTRNLACSWADRKVRVNALALGYFPSELTAPFIALPPFANWIASRTPMGRVGALDELVGPALLLASDAGSFITGHTLAVDGGYASSNGTATFPDMYYEIMGEPIPSP